jgi:hypothetical protein
MEHILNLGNIRRWVVSFTLQSLYPGAHWVGSWVGPKVDLDFVAKRKIMPCRESNPGRPSRSIITRYTD